MTWKLVPDTFLFIKKKAEPILQNDIFETS